MAERSRHGRHVAQCLLLLAGLQLGQGLWTGSSANVQTGSTKRSCEEVRHQQALEAVAEARRRLMTVWLQVGDNWYSAYKLKSQPRNPFDLKAPPELPVQGYIWAGGLACTVARGSRPEMLVVRFTAQAVSFNENGAGWTKPLRNAVVLSLAVARQNGQLVLTQMGDSSMAMEDEEARLPTKEELPPADEKLGVPCAASDRWHRSRCVPATDAR